MRTRLVCLAALAVGCGQDKGVAISVPPSPRPTASAATDDEAGFARALIAEFGRRGAKPGIRYDLEHHALVADGDQISLVNLYPEYARLAPSERADELKRIADTYGAAESADEAPFAAVRTSLLPVVRVGLYFDVELQLIPGKDPPPKQPPAMATKPLGEVTGAGIAIDRPESMEVVTADQLGRWHVTLDQALAIAVSNLAAKPTPFTQLQPGLWTSPARDSYEASRLLLTDQIAALGLHGEPVAMVPNRNTIYLAGSQDAKALLAMADLAEQAAAEPRPIHTVPLCLTRRTWAECEPAPTPAVRRRMHELAVRGRASLYADQQEALQTARGDALFVATLSLVQRKADGALLSYATWSRSVPTLLPRADFIDLVEPAPGSPDDVRTLGFVPWDRVVAVLGAHLARDQRSPPRWATGDYFPTAAELKQLAPVADPFDAR
jgi:hypothetical protein